MKSEKIRKCEKCNKSLEEGQKGPLCFKCIWEGYKKRQQKQEKMIREMNKTLHEGHVRALQICRNCFNILGRKGIRDNLLWSFEHRKEWIQDLIKEKKESNTDDFELKDLGVIERSKPKKENKTFFTSIESLSGEREQDD
jgi:ribosomal protein S14